MKTSLSSGMRVACLVGLIGIATWAHAQLAITEVMSSASNLQGTNRVTPHPDFWELTNFGTNTVDLADYRFSDSAGLSEQNMAADAVMFAGRSIAPMESIILVQRNDAFTNAAQFRSWWGDANLPAHLQIFTYPDQGRSFNSSRDAVQLWQITPTQTTLVHRVELYVAQRGVTFTYDPATGFLDSLSTLGERGTFKAVEANDVGSPGIHTGPVPLKIVIQPEGQAVDGGSPASFTVRATGLPPPRYQWHFNGVSIPDAVANLFEIPTTRAGDAGDYTVEVAHAPGTVLSQPARLQIDTTSTPPRIVDPPADLIVFPGQTAIFQIRVRGYEPPTVQWQFNGQDLADATNAILRVPHADPAHAGLYSVQIRNSLGTAQASASLTVRPAPNLVITEVMGSTSTNTTIFGRGDWWELTNFDTEAVQLRGYRFDDGPGVLEGALVITNDLVIQPGESILFIADMTPEFFTEWWGEENLPEHVQFFPYFGNGLDADGDSMTLWNATPLDESDFIARAEYLQRLNPDFTPVGGPSQTYWCEGYNEEGWSSVAGQCGAIQAARSDDVGSPGYRTNRPPRTVAPRCQGVAHDGVGVHLTWKTQVGRHYELLGHDDLKASTWTVLSEHTSEGTQLVVTDANPNGPQRFYRLRVTPGTE